MKELEKIVTKLESPDLTLTNALDSFEKGVGLMKMCDAQLKNAEGKLSELMTGTNGQFIEKILSGAGDELDGEESDD